MYSSQGHRARPARSGALGFDSEATGVLGIQARPPELHGFSPDDTPDGSIGKQALEHIQADVPARRAHRYEAAINVVPQRQACAFPEGFQLPPDVVVAPSILQEAGLLGARYT